MKYVAEEMFFRLIMESEIAVAIPSLTRVTPEKNVAAYNESTGTRRFAVMVRK